MATAERVTADGAAADGAAADGATADGATADGVAADNMAPSATARSSDPMLAKMLKHLSCPICLDVFTGAAWCAAPFTPRTCALAPHPTHA